MPIKAVLFDLFDTLLLIERRKEFYSPALMRMYKFLNKNGVDVTFETFEQAYLKSRDELYAKAAANLEEPHFNVRVINTLKLLGYEHISSRLASAATDEFCCEFMKVVSADNMAVDVLHTLRKRFKLGIISNFAIPECVDKLLKIHELDGLFDVILVSGAINKRKPSQEIFEKGLELLGVKPSEAVFVGDTLDADIDGAKAAGVKAIYIQRRNEKTENHAKPDLIIKSLSELPPLLENS